ncbi:TIGR00153 family protein [Porticoccus sp.]|uniref:TIGR00153 family protein n=1 Tax=Porticoccus sp. TaxID=2024853 RepID=UPI000C1034E4|nr:MAG: TIGR00153 family protein [Porticoccus sp.]
MVFSNPLSNLFGKSPISPLQAHMTVVVSCTEKLADFLAAAIREDWQQADKVFDEMSDLEHQADVMKRELRLQLPKSLFMPMDRTDLLNMLSQQDRIANRSKDIAGLMLGRKMVIPEPLQEKMGEFVGSAIEACRQAHMAINELDELLEVGFSGKEVDFVENLIRDLDKLEDRSDHLEQAIRHHLFKLETDLPPINVIFLYQVIDIIGEVADLSQSVGGKLQLLLAR